MSNSILNMYIMRFANLNSQYVEILIRNMHIVKILIAICANSTFFEFSKVIYCEFEFAICGNSNSQYVRIENSNSNYVKFLHVANFSSQYACVFEFAICTYYIINRAAVIKLNPIWQDEKCLIQFLIDRLVLIGVRCMPIYRTAI
jgi:hypothetical protein